VNDLMGDPVDVAHIHPVSEIGASEPFERRLDALGQGAGERGEQDAVLECRVVRQRLVPVDGDDSLPGSRPAGDSCRAAARRSVGKFALTGCRNTPHTSSG